MQVFVYEGKHGGFVCGSLPEGELRAYNGVTGTMIVPPYEFAMSEDVLDLIAKHFGAELPPFRLTVELL